MRRDAAVNRERLVKAAEIVFAERGPAATLDDVRAEVLTPNRLNAARATLRSGREPIDTSNPSGRLIFQMLATSQSMIARISERGLRPGCTGLSGEANTWDVYPTGTVPTRTHSLRS